MQARPCCRGSPTAGRVIPVIGASRPDQLDSAIAAVTTPMSAAAVDALDARSRRLRW
jgi:aryl-alcohol dehydrogenase-like predicted oxidoreductase